MCAGILGATFRSLRIKLTIADYERMLADQFGGCAICGRPEPEDGSLFPNDWLRARITELEGERAELTMTVGGERRMAGGDRIDVVQPHDHAQVLGVTAQATEKLTAGHP